ncbi:MAG: hypothetical protein GEU99_13805 [Luteitalea sp.]|nr:hypothetical protein [Luteitalea sp.]
MRFSPGTFDLGWMILAADIAIKSSILLIVALLLNASALRRAPASLRHVTLLLALISTLAVPALSPWLPSWPVPLLRVGTARGPAIALDSTTALTIQSSGLPAPVGPTTAPTPPALEAPAPRPAAVRPSAPGVWVDQLGWARLLGIIWFAGAVLLLLRIAVGTLRASRVARYADEPASWQALARRLARAFRVPRTIRFVRSETVVMPMACGLLRPMVALPAEADHWPRARLQAVLLHELAHVQRRDCFTQLIANVVCAIQWYHPLAWLAARQLRRERERACDDVVLASGMEGPDYAEHLLALARAARPAPFASVLSGSVAMARRSELEGRLIAILDERPRRRLTLPALVTTSLVACGLVTPLAAVDPWSYDAQQVAAQDKVGITSGVDAALGARAQAGAHALDVTALALDSLQLPTARPQPRPAPTTTPTPTPTPTPAPTTKPAPTTTPKTSRSDREQAERPSNWPRVIAALSEAVKDSDAEVRQTAVGALARLRDPGAFDALVTALGDKDPEVRQQAASGLGQLRDARSVEPLSMLVGDADAEVREQAVSALGQLRDPSTIPGLTAALKDASAEVREQAASALGQIGDARAVPPLAVALADKDKEVREQAASALGQIRDPKAVDALVQAVKDPSTEVRQQALSALGRIDSSDPRAVDAAMVALKDSDPKVRQMAAQALSRLLRHD